MTDSTGTQPQEKAGSFIKPGGARAPRKQLVSVRHNAAVSELAEEQPSLLQQRAAVRPVPASAAAQAPGGNGSRFGHDLSRVPTHTAAPAMVQPAALGLSSILDAQETDAAREVPRQQHQGHALASSGTGPVAETESRLPGGQLMRTLKIPFVQLVRSSRADEPQEQEAPVTVSEVEGPELIQSLDTISSTLGYASTTERGGAGPSGFGVCRASASLTDVHITPGSGSYTVTGTYELEIRWQVRSGTGPNSEVDIQSENDPDIRACNYQLVAKDITPNMGDLNGRPPRDHFWAEDLTGRHERVHATDYGTYGPDAATAAQNWLNAQTASSRTQIQNTLLRRALRESMTVLEALMETAPGAEQRAYGDGAPVYQARASAVRTKGDAGDYGQVSAQVTVHPRGGEPYEVVRGDTLSAIARRVYGEARYWREIYRANRDRVREGGNLIFPGTVLDLPPINIDQEVWVMLSSDAGLYASETVRVPGGSSHEFLVSPKDVFSDTTNCDASVTVDVCDQDGNSLVTAVWSLPGSTTSRHGNYEVTASVVR
jgi:hypothetical protein